MNKRLLALVVLVLLASGLFASTELKGSDYVRLGKTGTLVGTLSLSDGEWFLTTFDSQKYSLHLGNYEIIYPKGIELSSGAQAKVTGFLYENDFSVIAVDSNGKSWQFRNIDGRPLWSGQGNRQNAKEPV
ncbi:hypothetical protein [uncultured Sphaerochaeta sp.]|uniref:hypothetical protein n=1 Tax=uncultured Sphaerochaeta sp. TaxID=886478 RepID=UPI002A0A6D10|nr:hypothetical protein [uncultured Sphaerochaeta sp.]